MPKIVARILLIADFHWMIVKPWQQKGQTDKGILGVIVEFFISIWKLFNNRNVKKALKKISRMGEFDAVFSLGDLTECIYNERGMITENDIKGLVQVRELVERSIRAKTFYYLSGDHELGYKLPLSADPSGGVSLESVQNFQKIPGSLFGALTIGQFNLILLSSSLLIQKLNEPELVELRNKQFEMLDKALENIAVGEDVFIFLHDPDGLQEIEKYFDTPYFGSYYLRNKHFHTFCGHLHAEESLRSYEKLGRIANAKTMGEKIKRWIFMKNEKGRKVMRWAKGNLWRLEIFRKYDLHIIPATGGMMGKGGGFLILNLFEDGSFHVEKHKV